MNEYEIWIEGYAATGERSCASFIGRANGDSFYEACENFRYPENITRPSDGEIIVHKGEPLKLDKNRRYPSIWGCQLFDNEMDARK